MELLDLDTNDLEYMRFQWDPKGEVAKVRWKAIGGDDQFRMFVMK